MNIFEQIGMYLQYDFVKYALIVGILISLCCAILGVTLVLKRYAMIGGKHCAELARVLEKAGYEVYFKNKNLPDYYLNNFTLEERVKYALYKCN